jgi:soluble lytic murein transglycosylase-like protein
MGLPDRLAARLDPAHVRAVVAAASGGDPAALRRAFAYGVLARFG